MIDLQSVASLTENEPQTHQLLLRNDDVGMRSAYLDRIVFAHLNVVLEQQPSEEPERHLSLPRWVIVKIDRVEDLRWRNKDVWQRSDEKEGGRGGRGGEQSIQNKDEGSDRRLRMIHITARD